MANRVIDASALLAFLRDEKGAEFVQSAFDAASMKGHSLLMMDTSLGELKRTVMASKDASWKEVRAAISSLPLEFVSTTVELAELAGNDSKTGSDIELAFSIALTHAKKGELITARPVAKDI